MKSLKTRIVHKNKKKRDKQIKKYHYDHNYHNSDNPSSVSTFIENSIPNNPCDVYESVPKARIILSHESSIDTIEKYG